MLGLLNNHVRSLSFFKVPCFRSPFLITSAPSSSSRSTTTQASSISTLTCFLCSSTCTLVSTDSSSLPSSRCSSPRCAATQLCYSVQAGENYTPPPSSCKFVLLWEVAEVGQSSASPPSSSSSASFPRASLVSVVCVVEFPDQSGEMGTHHHMTHLPFMDTRVWLWKKGWEGRAYQFHFPQIQASRVLDLNEEAVRPLTHRETSKRKREQLLGSSTAVANGDARTYHCIDRARMLLLKSGLTEDRYMSCSWLPGTFAYDGERHSIKTGTQLAASPSGEKISAVYQDDAVYAWMGDAWLTIHNPSFATVDSSGFYCFPTRQLFLDDVQKAAQQTLASLPTIGSSLTLQQHLLLLKAIIMQHPDLPPLPSWVTCPRMTFAPGHTFSPRLRDIMEDLYNDSHLFCTRLRYAKQNCYRYSWNAFVKNGVPLIRYPLVHNPLDETVIPFVLPQREKHVEFSPESEARAANIACVANAFLRSLVCF